MSENPGRRPTASERRARKGKSGNPYATTSASVRREQERARTGQGSAPADSKSSALSQEQIAEILANPTRTVTTEELRREYGFVLRDIRSMFVVAGGLVLLEIIMALVLPG
jgi:hypothetical protein